MNLQVYPTPRASEEILVGAKLSLVLFGAAFLRCAIFKAPLRVQGFVEG